MLKIYHNPRCRKSRAGLEYLKSKQVDFKIVDYLNTGLTTDQVHEILLKANLKAIDLVRKQEDIYKKELKGKSFQEEEWIRIICENPKLLERPIVVSRYKAVIGNPMERIDEMIQ
jgi:arsenate reductase (glutaredoxin)